MLKKNKDNSETPEGRKARRPSFSPFKPRDKQPNFILSVLCHTVCILLVVVLVFGVGGFGALMGVAKGYYETTPDLDVDKIEAQNLTSFIYDCNGELITAYKGTENRVWAYYDEIPENLVYAFVAVEDARFFTHNGIDIKRIIGAFVSNLQNESTQGGSTITQQLVKTTLLSTEQSYKRKLQEAYLAIELESEYSKEQILEWYLNYIYLGEGCYGVATAAQNYFGKELSELDLAECASLISITNNPSAYNPYRYLENNQYRATLVLGKMLELGSINQSEYDEAMAEIDDLASHLERSTDEARPATIYNWYDEQVITDVMNDLIEKYGYSEQVASDMVTSGGLNIYACVDPEIQSIVESVYSDRSNLQLTSKSGQAIQSAIVIIDPQGNIVGLAGALGEKSSNRGWNYASRSLRQPGSSIKPLSVYAPALESGVISPASAFDDYPVQLLSGKAWPLNNPQTYRGRMTVAAALEVSSNPVAVRTLQNLGVENSFQFMEEKFHIDLEDGRTVNGQVMNDLGASQLALGGLTDGVSVVDMAAAYSVFPRNGLYVEPRTYTKVTRVLDDGTEEVLLDNTQNQPEAVLSEETTWYINDMLKNVVTGKFGGATGTGAQLSGMTVAGKTGTTNSNNDKWFVGYTPYYTAAVWVGYNNPERISSSNNPAVSMWKKVMAPIHEGLENKSFPAAGSEQKSVSICMDSGLRATEACLNDPRGSRARTFTLFSDDVPAETCSLHKEVEVCTGSPVLGGDGTAIEGLYHLAGEFCPRQADEGAGVTEGTVKTIGILDYSRESVGGAAAKDSSYLYSFLEAQGTCDVHTTAPQPQEPEEYDPNSFVISDPSTWPPVNDPRYENFDPENPATWPNAGQPSETPSPGESGQPNPPETSTSPTPSPVPTPVETPPDEPYIPADGTK